MVDSDWGFIFLPANRFTHNSPCCLTSYSCNVLQWYIHSLTAARKVKYTVLVCNGATLWQTCLLVAERVVHSPLQQLVLSLLLTALSTWSWRSLGLLYNPSILVLVSSQQDILSEARPAGDILIRHLSRSLLSLKEAGLVRRIKSNQKVRDALRQPVFAK